MKTKIDSAKARARKAGAKRHSRYVASSRCVGTLRHEDFNVRSRTDTDR